MVSADLCHWFGCIAGSWIVAKRLARDALKGRKACGRFIRVGRLVVARERVGALVPHIPNSHRRGSGELTLDGKIPGIYGRKDVGITADLCVVSHTDGNQATRWNRGKDKGGWSHGKVEGSCVHTAIG